MASSSPDAGDLPEPVVERALAFAFGLGDLPWYTAERTVLGVPVVFRVLSPAEGEACNEAAFILDSPAAQETERWVQRLARAVVSVDGQELPASLPWRLAHFRGMPEGAMARAYEQLNAVQAEYWQATGPDAVKN